MMECLRRRRREEHDDGGVEYAAVDIHAHAAADACEGGLVGSTSCHAVTATAECGADREITPVPVRATHRVLDLTTQPHLQDGYVTQQCDDPWLILAVDSWVRLTRRRTAESERMGRRVRVGRSHSRFSAAPERTLRAAADRTDCCTTAWAAEADCCRLQCGRSQSWQ